MTVRKLTVCILIGLTLGWFVAEAYAAVTYSLDGRPTAYWWTGNAAKDQALLAAREVEDMMEGSVGFDTGILLTPTDVVPTATEGMIYYNDSGNTLQMYTGSAWVSIDTAGASSLDTAYGIGSAVDVDTSAITLTTSDADDNVVLAVVQNEATNDNDAVTITMGTGATGSALLINSQTSGTDITGDNWSVDLQELLAAALPSIRLTTLPLP